MKPTAIVRLAVTVGSLVAVAAVASAQESVRITTPASVSFNVPNVSVDVTASPVRVSFDTAVLLPIHRLRISVRADSSTFTSPQTANVFIAASKITWTTSNATSGTGSPGTLSSSSYGAIFDGQALALSGGADVTWTLKAPGGGIRAGAHTLVIRYKVESF
jgi:hypothetical protein